MSKDGRVCMNFNTHPSGQVLNLAESVAVTQNYVSRHNVKNVLNFLRRKENKTLFNEFVAKLRERQPEILSEIESGWAKEEQERQEREKKREEGGFWNKLKHADLPSPTEGNLFSGGFSFSFNFDATSSS